MREITAERLVAVGGWETENVLTANTNIDLCMFFNRVLMFST